MGQYLDKDSDPLNPVLRDILRGGVSNGGKPAPPEGDRLPNRPDEVFDSRERHPRHFDATKQPFNQLVRYA
ncbi:MAG: hypothetical protein ABSH52_33225 [Terriglobia bacterium]